MGAHRGNACAVRADSGCASRLLRNIRRCNAERAQSCEGDSASSCCMLGEPAPQAEFRQHVMLRVHALFIHCFSTAAGSRALGKVWLKRGAITKTPPTVLECLLAMFTGHTGW